MQRKTQEEESLLAGFKNILQRRINKGKEEAFQKDNKNKSSWGRMGL